MIRILPILPILLLALGYWPSAIASDIVIGYAGTNGTAGSGSWSATTNGGAVVWAWTATPVNLVTDGTFQGGATWTYTTDGDLDSWSWDAGETAAYYDSNDETVPSTPITVYQAGIAIASGGVYRVTFTLYSSGGSGAYTVRPRLGTVVGGYGGDGTNRTADGTYTDDITATAAVSGLSFEGAATVADAWVFLTDVTLYKQ